MLRIVNRIGRRSFATRTTKPNVWVVTDGGIESTLQAMALGKQLAGSNTLSNTFKLKTIVASKSKIPSAIPRGNGFNSIILRVC